MSSVQSRVSPSNRRFFINPLMHYFSYDHETLIIHGGCSSVVEHSTADRNVLGSIPSVPFQSSFFINPFMHYFSYDHETLIIHGDRNVLGSIPSVPFQPSFFLNPFMHYFSYDHETLIIHVSGSVVEHSTADRNVLGSDRECPLVRHFFQILSCLLRP
ncbi:unnamed protein product [Acanthosepion pharaonis]|uniref:Uncharacterized protein n=1 Tax=Acanthosepion pharaonis TaxID=158019 RepID=A0A812BPT6_ACAPH|nr:unnamed protein product [Sepia pharaonis]